MKAWPRSGLDRLLVGGVLEEGADRGQPEVAAGGVIFRRYSRSSRDAVISGASSAVNARRAGGVCSRWWAKRSSRRNVSRYERIVCGLAWSCWSRRWVKKRSSCSVSRPRPSKPACRSWICAAKVAPSTTRSQTGSLQYFGDIRNIGTIRSAISFLDAGNRQIKSKSR
jgi:hypothetical protein